jgi:flagellar assembly protein FliH
VGASDRFSRTISKDKVGEASQWELRPLAAGTRVAGSAALSPHGPGRAGGSGREQSGYEAGQAQGYAEATLKAQQARAADKERFDGLLEQLQVRFDELSSQTADALLDLALDIAGQVLRHEVQTRRDGILPVVREALAFVIETYAHPTVRLAPADFDLVRESLRGDGQLHGCRVVADAAMTPGGCRVETPQGEVDATLATRWRRVIQTLGVNNPPPDIVAEVPCAAATMTTAAAAPADAP